MLRREFNAALYRSAMVCIRARAIWGVVMWRDNEDRAQMSCRKIIFHCILIFGEKF